MKRPAFFPPLSVVMACPGIAPLQAQIAIDAAIARMRERARAVGGAAALAPALEAPPNQRPLTLRLLAVHELVKGRTSATNYGSNVSTAQKVSEGKVNIRPALEGDTEFMPLPNVAKR